MLINSFIYQIIRLPLCQITFLNLPIKSFKIPKSPFQILLFINILYTKELVKELLDLYIEEWIIKQKNKLQ